MKFYLIDDDASVCNILKIIIQQKKLGDCLLYTSRCV